MIDNTAPTTRPKANDEANFYGILSFDFVFYCGSTISSCVGCVATFDCAPEAKKKFMLTSSGPFWNGVMVPNVHLCVVQNDVYISISVAIIIQNNEAGSCIIIYSTAPSYWFLASDESSEKNLTIDTDKRSIPWCWY
jgi:hypothetical protein